MSINVKGLVLKSRLDYVKKVYGDEAYARVLEKLSPESLAAVQGGVLISSWYPVDLSIEMLLVIDSTLGKGDLALCREMGRYSAKAALAGVYKSFAREKDLDFVNRMTPTIWKQYYDSGEMKTESIGPGQVATRITGFSKPHRAICLGTLGWLEAANEVWGASDKITVEETKCRARGDDLCEFVISGTARV